MDGGTGPPLLVRLEISSSGISVTKRRLMVSTLTGCGTYVNDDTNAAGTSDCGGSGSLRCCFKGCGRDGPGSLLNPPCCDRVRAGLITLPNEMRLSLSAACLVNASLST